MRLGDLLVKVGLINSEQLARALEAQAIHGGRLGTNLVELGFITERQLAGSLSEQMGLPYVTADMASNISPTVLAAVPAEVAAEFQTFPIRLKGNVLYVCMASPADLEIVDALAFRLSRSLQPCVVTELTLNFTLERYYGVPRKPRFFSAKPESIPDSAFVRIADGNTGHPGGMRMSRGDFLSTESGEYFRGDFSGLPRVATHLASVNSEADIAEGMRLFFSAAFPQSVILAVSGSTLTSVAEAGLRHHQGPFPSLLIPVREDFFLRLDPQSEALKFHATLTEPTLVLACEQLGLAPHQITVIPIKIGPSVRYLVLGRGLDLPEVRRILPAIKNLTGQLACAFQIVNLRRRLLEGSASCEAGCQ